MEDEMNSEGTSTFSVDEVVRLIETLYHSSNTADQTLANKQLTEIQSSDRVWQICWPLLDPYGCRSLEVNFFAANTLVLKINQSWAQQDQDWLENELRPKLFEALVTYASSPNAGKLVVERLALALATFALHSIPTFWPDAIENILQSFTPQNLRVSISSQLICDILLKILMYIPEEYAVLMPQQDHRAKLNGQMTKSGPIVFKFLQNLLTTDKNAISPECRQNVLKCLISWTLHSKTSLLEMEDGQSLLSLLYELISDGEVCSLACTALATTFSSQKADSYTNSVMEFIPKIANLKDIIHHYVRNDEIECAIKVYSLVINFSENHSKLFLKIVINDGLQLEPDVAERLQQPIFTIIRIILDCTSAVGTYEVNEKYSDLAFSFWFTFFENFYYYSESFNDIICRTFDPLVDSLVQILTKKSKYPTDVIYYQTWDDDQRESYRCYRQDIGDNISLVVQFPRSRERILASLHDSLSEELNSLLNPTHEAPWQGFESIVFALKSASEAVPFDEAKHMPEIFGILSRVQFNESHALLYCSVAEMISAYSDWLFSNRDHLATAFTILFLGVNSNNSHARLMSTISLKDLTSECQSVLEPYAYQIVKYCTTAILQSNSNLSTNEKSRLMYTIGTTLAVSDTESVFQSLRVLTTPLICDLMSKSQLDPTPDANCRSSIFETLSMLNSLIESLYIKQCSGNEYENDDENDPKSAIDPSRIELNLDNDSTIQPSIGLLKQLVPILTIISTKYRSDEDIMGIIGNTIKRSAKSLGIELKPLLKDLLTILVNAYDPLVNSNILDGSVSLYTLFRTDKSIQPILKDVFASISDKTIQVCIGSPLRLISLTIENYFRYASFVCKKCPDIITIQCPMVNIDYIYKLAIASLELPERRSLVEVCNFLIQFRQKSIGVDYLHKIFVSHLDIMLINIFNILGGNYSTPRNAIDNVTDLLFLVMDPEASKEPFKRIIEKGNFPTEYVTCDHKAKFVSRILHEKNRKKFKEACSEFVLIARNLNRLM